MGNLTEDQLDRLRRARRAMIQRAWVMTVIAIAIMVVMVEALGSRRSPTAIGLGLVALGIPLVLIPYTKSAATLGLSRGEADAILAHDRYTRSALAAMPPEQRAERLRSNYLAWLATAAFGAVGFVACAAMFIATAGETATEDNNVVTVVAIGAFGAMATFILTPLAATAALRAKAAEAVVRRQIASQLE